MVYVGNRYLTLEEMKVNAQYILNWFTSRGWSKHAVCGMLGNMQSESTINPGIWEGLQEGNLNVGFGLVQWTPASKYIDWAVANGYSITDINGQCQRIIYELENGLQYYPTSQYPMTFREFSVSTQSPEYLAQVFLVNYERPLNPNQPQRSTQARYWFDLLVPGGDPGGPGGPGEPGEPVPIPSGEPKDLIHLLLAGALNGW